MRVFITGASGFVGSAVVQELISAGHKVVGLARSDASGKALAAAGAEVLRGSLEDQDSLRSGAAASDGVIHLAFIINLNNYLPSSQKDQIAIKTIGESLAGSNKPFVVTSGTLMAPRGRIVTEEDVATLDYPRRSEDAALPFADRGVRVSIIRLPPTVHDEGDHRFIPALIGIARQKGVSAYVGDGMNRWPAVHRRDAARLYRLALEKGQAGSRYHGASEAGIPFRHIAEGIGKGLNIPVVSKTPTEAVELFGSMGQFIQADNPTSSKKTHEELGWHPTEIVLLEDVAQHYFAK